MGLYTELFYAIIPACFLTFCCSAIPTSPYNSNVLYTKSCRISTIRLQYHSLPSSTCCTEVHGVASFSGPPTCAGEAGNEAMVGVSPQGRDSYCHNKDSGVTALPFVTNRTRHE